MGMIKEELQNRKGDKGGLKGPKGPKGVHKKGTKLPPPPPGQEAPAV
jgi:hypothetical protein